ncbi:vicilin-like seed storage protein At4g36700 [Rutidosis leptorrhynchoides]|uniref:vicilin-like seed storage protein At4g36700 n=1 Tax=Rutidosis leptorrhynchoides TaxID=125765 RepID=UPI003A994C73
MTNTTSYLSISVVLSAYFVVSLLVFFPHSTTALHEAEKKEESGNIPVPVNHGTLVKKDQRRSLVTAESGEISAVKVSDGRDGFYHLQFITMEPNSLFLPVHLHSDMVFYVDSGSGTLSWIDVEKDDDKLKQVELHTGDVYRLPTGSFFYLQSSLESDRRKLRINAIFSDSKDEIREGSTYGAYASVRDLVLGFDNKVLQAALGVDEEVIRELRSGENQPMIVHGVTKKEQRLSVHYRIMRAFVGRMKNEIVIDVNKKSKNKAYNILDAKRDVENCNGWSLVVTSKQLDALKDSDFGVYMVNLTKGAMMGPHWNPMTAEIAVALRGRGMVRVVCPSTIDETECKNSRFRVEEGDVFVVPRYHPMAQISFNNESFVFVGFTTTQKNNHPQYLVGSASVFQALDKEVLATSLGVSNRTMDEILSAQREAIIVECTSCAEDEERLMEEEIQREEEEEAKRKEEEERKKEEEEIRKREEEEEAKREQEEKRKKEEEEAKERKEEAAREQEEEEARKREEEAAKQREEEARRRQQEEEAARQEEEEARRRQREEAGRRRQEEQEEEARRRQEEEDAARQEEEEAARRWQEEEESARKRKEQREEEARRQQEEEASRQQEEEARRQEEEEARRQEEEAARQRREQEEEEAARRREEADRQQQEADRQQQEEEAARRQQRQGEGRRRGGGGRGGQGGEGEAARREEEEMARRQREADAASRGRRGGGSLEE